MTHTTTRLPLLLLVLLGLASSAPAQTSFFDLLYAGDDDHTPRAITVTLPLDSVYRKADAKFPATVAFTDVAGEAREWDLKMNLRGRFRRVRCPFPPLKFDLPKKDLRAADLADHDKFKLVTHCADDELNRRLLLKEYLAYRAYALLTPYSFRVQLLEVTYVDAAGQHPSVTQLGFLLEDPDEMAEHAGGVEIEEALNLPPAAFSPRAEADHAVFQYLIGNADYSLPMLRNLKLVEIGGPQLVPVGYDFDFSGWVGSPYASATLEVGATSIYDRVYLGFARPDHVLRKSLLHFQDRRPALEALITNFELLERAERDTLLRWIARFYLETGRMLSTPEVPLYEQLRGEAAELVPTGGEAGNFRLRE